MTPEKEKRLRIKYDFFKTIEPIIKGGKWSIIENMLDLVIAEANRNIRGSGVDNSNPRRDFRYHIGGGDYVERFKNWPIEAKRILNENSSLFEQIEAMDNVEFLKDIKEEAKH